jgi:pyruvate,water dikinase
VSPVRSGSVVLWLEEIRTADVERVGGKLARLGELAARGHPVPPGFAVPCDVFTRALGAEIRDEIAMVTTHAPSDLAALEATATRVRELVEEAPVPPWLEDDVARAYDELAQRCGLGQDLPTAVRSSGVGEDGRDASFAGQFDTYLGVRGADAVVRHVRRCWASQYTVRALDYRRRKGIPADAGGIAVGVLQLLRAATSGIVFTVNPVDGDRTQAVIEASWGLGEAVVSGQVTPDRWVVDKASGQILAQHTADKDVQMVFDDDAGRIVEQPVSGERRRAASLSPEQVRHVVRFAAALEERDGCPQDVEWAFDERLPFPDSFFVLQHRPETVWSKRPEPQGHDAVAYALQNVFGIPPRESR